MSLMELEVVKTEFAALIGAMKILVDSKDPQDLCKRLVFTDYRLGTNRGSYIYVLNQQSRLVKIAGFGESVFDSIEEISAWDENPASKCILKKDQVFIGPDKGLGESPILAIPFIKQDVPVGCLAMAFSREFAESPVAASIVPAFSQLGAFFLENSLTNPITNLQKISTPEELTTRQIQILSYMGDGLTNSEIAAQVLLSESTVRQETIRIYRILSVKSRQDAVLAARSLGLIKPVRMQ